MLNKNYRTEKRDAELPPPPTSIPEMQESTVEMEEAICVEARDVLVRFRQAIHGHSRWEQDISKLLPMVSRKMAYNKVGVHNMPRWEKGIYAKKNIWWGVAYYLLSEFMHAFAAAIVDHDKLHYEEVRDRINKMLTEGLNNYTVDLAPMAGFVLRNKAEIHAERRAENERVRQRRDHALRDRSKEKKK